MRWGNRQTRKASANGPKRLQVCLSSPRICSFRLPILPTYSERAKVLAKRLELPDASEQLTVLMQHLSSMRQRDDTPSLDTRRELYFNARRVLREIAFQNPLLKDIDKLLFVKRHDAAGVFHMCDQYYGFNSVPGGGIYVLENPFEGKPRLYNLLENAVVEKGRLAGQKLEGGCFVSPDLSYDGQKRFISLTVKQLEHQVNPELGTPPPEEAWTPETSYHLFRVNADGAGLEQLTDGSEKRF